MATPSRRRTLDRQGSNVFVRLRQFAGSLCGSMKPCTVRFWSEQLSGAFTMPLSAAHERTQLAEYTHTDGPRNGRVSPLR